MKKFRKGWPGLFLAFAKTPVSDCVRAQSPRCASTRAPAQSALAQNRQSSSTLPGCRLSYQARSRSWCLGRWWRSWDSLFLLGQKWCRGRGWWCSPSPSLFALSNLRRKRWIKKWIDIWNMNVYYLLAVFHLQEMSSKTCTRQFCLARACLGWPGELLQTLSSTHLPGGPGCHLFKSFFVQMMS